MRDTGLEARLRVLTVETRLAVHSYLGLSITLVVDGHLLRLTVLDGSATAAGIATSARLPLSALGHGTPGSQIVFYAATPGAFVDFAADVTHVLGIDNDTVVLDQDRSPPTEIAGVDGLGDLTRFNQAIGILIARGHTPEGAQIEIGRLARQAKESTGVVAKRLIDSIMPRPATEQA